MTDLLDALQSRSTRGAPRGADAVWEAAAGAPRPDRPRRIAAAIAVAVVVLLVGAAVVAVRAGTDPQGQTPAEQGPPDDTEVALDPADVNAIVANGSGVSGAAAAVAAELAGLGFGVLPPINTVVSPDDTPLDTVYHATSPDTRPQALLVAEALGLREDAVLPIPEVGAPAPLGLAEVMVVVGSAPGQLAAAVGADGPTYLVEPESGLQDGQVVNVRGEGYGDDQGVQAIQCTYDDQACDQSTAVGWSTPGGRFDEEFTVRRHLTTSTGEVDCRELQCALFVGVVGDAGPPTSSFLDFG
jgi:hypothetical protein